MTEADPRDANRRVQFPEAGDGVELILRNSATRTLMNLYGDNYMAMIEGGLLTNNINVIDKMLDLCGFKDGEKHPLRFDDLDHITIEAIATKLLDAFTLACNGRSYLEQVAKIRAEAEAGQEKKPDPTTGPVDSSESSSEEPTGPDSGPASSTT